MVIKHHFHSHKKLSPAAKRHCVAISSTAGSRQQHSPQTPSHRRAGAATLSLGSVIASIDLFLHLGAVYH